LELTTGFGISITERKVERKKETVELGRSSLSHAAKGNTFRNVERKNEDDNNDRLHTARQSLQGNRSAILSELRRCRRQRFGR